MLICPDLLKKTTHNYGAFPVAHLLLEEAASRGLLYQRPMDVDVYLNCHQRKLQILMAAAGIGECLESCKSLLLKSGSNTRYASDIDTQESSSKQCWNLLVAEEVKSISQCVSQVKNWIDQSGDFDTIPMSSTGDMQCLLLSVVYNIASIFLSKKSSGPVNTDQIERSWFIEASIAFCKIQHLNAMINVNTQIKPEEIAAILKDFDQPRTLAPTGLFLGGTKYMVIQGEPCAVIRGKKGSGGITIKKTSQALLIGIYDEPVTPGRCNIVVERLGDYLIEQGL